MTLPKKTTPKSSPARLAVAIGLLVVAAGALTYSLWGGTRPGEAEPGTPQPQTAEQTPPTEPMPAPQAKPAPRPAAAQAEERPNPHKEGGRMIPTDAKPGGS